MTKTIVILHGWGSLVSGSKRFEEVKKLFEQKGYTVFTPDLPGFGDNTLKADALVFDDYVSFVGDFLKKKKLSKVILIGHSFGGRIAIRYAALHPNTIDKLILVNASGVPQKLSFRKKIIASTTKVVRPLFDIPPFSSLYMILRKVVYYLLGEMDYYKSGNLAKTFKNVYRVSIVEDLKKIVTPTLVIWGEKDTMTPLANGKYMNQQIKGSTLVIVENATHKLPYENPEVFTQKVVDFLKK